MVDLGRASQDPYWILINQNEQFRVINQNGASYNNSTQDFDENNQQKVLVIEKKFCKIYEKNYCQEDERRYFQQIPISGLLGVVNIQGQNFVLVITEKQNVGKIDGANIFLIKGVDLIPFYEDQQQLNLVRSYVDGIKKLLQTGFYFSYNTDLTSNRQRTANLRKQGQMQGGTDSYTIWESCDKRYFWNYNICQDFLYQKVDPTWIVPIIQGYVEYSSQIFDGKELEILLISRRRFMMAGTRYNARGLDDEGNVANYVETEQILCYRNHVYSFVQIRGSVPLFWQQKGLQAHTTVKRNNALTASAFDKHLSDMVSDYRFVIIINLLQKGRSYEYMLTEAFEQLIQMCQPKCVKYTYYDFHTETKGDVSKLLQQCFNLQNFQRLNDLMTKIEEMLVKRFQYFVEDRNTGKILQEQKGVMRTNCLDCLDRTNVTQTMIAKRILENILDKIKSLNRQNHRGSQRMQDDMMLGFNGDNGDSFIFDVMKNMWAENGDMISKQYAGTSSTITSVTKTGKQGFMGKIDQMRRGVERFLVNNIEDGTKHECIKLVVNQHPQQQNYGVRAQLERQMEKYQNHFTSWQDILVNVVSWNLAGNCPPPTFDIGNILFHEGQQQMPDIFIIGLQEMVKLNAKSVLQGKDRERVMLWENIVTNSLCKKQRYVCVSRKPMVGCFILLFIKDEHKNRISSIRTSKVKTGLAGQSGNKGSVAIRFNFDNSSFAFIDCHLASGQSKTCERLDDLREIYKKSFDCSQKYQDFMIQTHDYKFIFGDLNFRIALPFESVKEEIRRKNYKLLQEHDQLLNVKGQSSILQKFSEGQLNFDPTYKYDDHSNNYDTSQKRRIPAWCDRILYEKNQNCGGKMDLLRYGRKESYFSDHRPVYGIFRVAVCKIDIDKRQDIEYKLLDQLFPGVRARMQNFGKMTQSQIMQENNAQQESNVKLGQFNIQEGYLDNRQNPQLQKQESNNSTKALDDLLAFNHQNSNKDLTESQAIDELLKSNVQNSQIDDLISLSPDKNSRHQTNQFQSNDLIDLNFGSVGVQSNNSLQANHQLHPQRSFEPQMNQQLLPNLQQNMSHQQSFNTAPLQHNTLTQFNSSNMQQRNMQQQQQMTGMQNQGYTQPQQTQQQQQQRFNIQQNYMNQFYQQQQQQRPQNQMQQMQAQFNNMNMNQNQVNNQQFMQQQNQQFNTQVQQSAQNNSTNQVKSDLFDELFSNNLNKDTSLSTADQSQRNTNTLNSNSYQDGFVNINQNPQQYQQQQQQQTNNFNFQANNQSNSNHDSNNQDVQDFFTF